LTKLSSGEVGARFTDPVPFKETIKKINLSDVIEYAQVIPKIEREHIYVDLSILKNNCKFKKLIYNS
jgi:hypothetical protein